MLKINPEKLFIRLQNDVIFGNEARFHKTFIIAIKCFYSLLVFLNFVNKVFMRLVGKTNTSVR